MNKVFFIGGLTRDPELTQTQNGVPFCRFTLAVGRTYPDVNGERQADYFSCTAWRGQAENIAKFCKKGSKVAVVGSIQIRSYENSKGGSRTAVDVMVQECEFLSTQKKNDGEDVSVSVLERPARKKNTEDDGDLPY